MNSTLQAKAQKLFFQSDLSKTEISEMLGIPRRTLHYWIREKNWDRIKRSSAQMPSLLAENIYHIIARFTQQLLGEDRINRPITHKEADTLHKLTLTIGKLKTRNTLNESMEMFGLFMESVNQKSPEMAQQLVPFVDDYISGRAATNIQQFRPDNMNDLGLIPKQDANLTEEQLDMQDIMAWTEADHPPVDLEKLEALEEQHEAAIANGKISPATPPRPRPLTGTRAEILARYMDAHSDIDHKTDQLTHPESTPPSGSTSPRERSQQPINPETKLAA
jgi:hypothetical protein